MRIDAHAHVWLQGDSLDTERLARLIDACDRLEIDWVWCSCPVISGLADPATIRRHNDATLEAMRLWPERVRGYCFAIAGWARESRAEIDRCLGEGMIGLKLYNQYLANDPVVFPVIEKAAGLRLPVLWHAGHVTDSESRRIEPLISDGVHFAELALRYPEATVIMAHLGGGGDYEWSLQAIADYPNLYADTSGSVIDDGMVEYATRLLGANRLLFGCDETEEGGVGKVLGADLSDDERQAIFSGNALRLLDQRHT